MKTQKFHYAIKALLASSCLGLSSIHAAVITDTALATSPGTATADLINPLGISLTTATGATAEATFEAIENLQVIQAFSSSLTAGTNVFAFTDGDLPDIQTSFSSGASASGARLPNGSFVSSGSDSMRIQGDRAGQFSMTIDFGIWNGVSFESTGATASAAAFTLVGTTSSTAEFSGFSAAFLDEADATITTLTLSGTSGYFGYQSATPIGSIVITFNPVGSNDGPLGFDDLAFVATAAVPEPSTTALILAGLSLCAVAYRRKKSV